MIRPLVFIAVRLLELLLATLMAPLAPVMATGCAMALDPIHEWSAPRYAPAAPPAELDLREASRATSRQGEGEIVVIHPLNRGRAKPKPEGDSAEKPRAGLRVMSVVLRIAVAIVLAAVCTELFALGVGVLFVLAVALVVMLLVWG